MCVCDTVFSFTFKQKIQSKLHKSLKRVEEIILTVNMVLLQGPLAFPVLFCWYSLYCTVYTVIFDGISQGCSVDELWLVQSVGVSVITGLPSQRIWIHAPKRRLFSRRTGEPHRRSRFEILETKLGWGPLPELGSMEKYGWPSKML